MICDSLIPIRQGRFPGRGLKSGIPPEPCAIFPAMHPEVGDIQIYDDGDEITLVAGHFTHGHFSNYDDLPLAVKEKIIAGNVVTFLDKLFSDHVVLWGSKKGGGGWRVVDQDSMDKTKHEKEYVWSGPRRISYST